MTAAPDRTPVEVALEPHAARIALVQLYVTLVTAWLGCGPGLRHADYADLKHRTLALGRRLGFRPSESAGLTELLEEPLRELLGEP